MSGTVTIRFEKRYDNDSLLSSYMILEFSKDILKIKQNIIDTMAEHGLEVTTSGDFEETPAILVNFKPIRGKEKQGYSFNRTFSCVVDALNSYNEKKGTEIVPVVHETCSSIFESLERIIDDLRRRPRSAFLGQRNTEIARIHGQPEPEPVSTEVDEAEYPEDIEKREKQKEEQKKNDTGEKEEKPSISSEEAEALTLAYLAQLEAEGNGVSAYEQPNVPDEELGPEAKNERYARDLAGILLTEITNELINLAKKYPDDKKENAIFFQTKEEQLARIDQFIKKISLICSKYESKRPYNYQFYTDSAEIYTVYHAALEKIDHSPLITQVNDLAMFYELNGNKEISSFADLLERLSSEEVQEDKGKGKEKSQILDKKSYLKETINAAVKDYLEWMSINAQGTRGLTRFSHWHHGGSGIARAHVLRDITNSDGSSYEQIVDKMREVMQQSSNTDHSLKQYLEDAFGYEQLKDICDQESSQIGARYGN